MDYWRHTRSPGRALLFLNALNVVSPGHISGAASNTDNSFAFRRNLYSFHHFHHILAPTV